MNTLPEPGSALFWLVRAPDHPLPEHLEALTPEERERALRFRGAERQARFVTGRALLRCLLGERLGLAPTAVPIRVGDRRRPEFHGRADLRPIDFNLSSTAGVVACVIAHGVRVGVDVERPARIREAEALAERIFTAAERRWWRRAERPDLAFCRLWTLKESIAKADGEGIGLPFGQLTVLPDDAGGIEMDLRAMHEEAGNWTVLELEAEVPAALAFRGASVSAGAIELAPDLPQGIDFERLPARRRSAWGLRED